MALVQLGGIGTNKAENLKHAREMIIKAARLETNSIAKPDLIVLPVRASCPFILVICIIQTLGNFQLALRL
jgi:omega-amidase